MITDVDPKSVLCAYFKAGSCRRGKRCKFSHDLSIARKSAKINVYEDPRKTGKLSRSLLSRGVLMKINTLVDHDRHDGPVGPEQTRRSGGQEDEPQSK